MGGSRSSTPSKSPTHKTGSSSRGSPTRIFIQGRKWRFVEKTVRAIKEIQALNPPADFLMFGGDLAQLADPVELKLGAELLKEVQIKHFIPGEHDWYLDMGKLWTSNFGKAPWTFDHKGVRFVGLDTVSRAPDYWSAKKMSPKSAWAIWRPSMARSPAPGLASAWSSSHGWTRPSPAGARTSQS